MAVWLATVTKALEEDEDSDTPREWTLSADDLFRLPALRAITAWPPERLSDYGRFHAAVVALQALDRWHRPLVPQIDGSAHARNADHESAADRLAIEDCFGADEVGRIIPWAVWPRRVNDLESAHDSALRSLHASDPVEAFPGATSCPALLVRLLAETTYLPHRISAEDGDAPDLTTGRTASLAYRRPATRGGPTRAFDRPLRVAVSPMMVAHADATFELTADRRRYAVCPSYPPDRLDAIVSLAFEHGVELLLFPETSVAEAELERLASAILSANRRYFRDRGDEAALLYVLAGVAGPPSPGGRHRNYVVLIDAFGEIIARQHKLFPWNMNRDQISRFGLDRQFGTLSDPLFEDIEPADEVVILDLDDLGRMINLICADVSYNLPGDWLLTHLRSDWLHAPILDQSTCWTFHEGLGIGPWIIRRAHRAACAGHCRVLVTNSMALTHRVNASNAARGIDKAFPECGVGLFVDAMHPTPTYLHLRVGTSESFPILKEAVWSDDWAPFGPTQVDEQ